MRKFNSSHFAVMFSILILLGVGCAKVSDGSDVEEIEELEEKYHKEAEKAADPEAKIDKEVYRDLLDAYINFVEKYPEAEQSPEYLYLSAQLYNDSRGLDNKGKAIELYTRTFTEYPEHEKAPVSMFMVGYIYANDLRDELKAERLYNKFLETYPKDRMAASARSELKNLGKTPAETLDMIQKKRSDGSVTDSLGDS